MKKTAHIFIAATMALASLQATAAEPGKNGEILLNQENAKAEKRMAVVNLSTIYMRQQPDYESALETQELMGTVVEIVGESGYWREIISPQPYRAWTTEKCLTEMGEDELKAYEEAPKVMFTGLYGHIYSSPSTQSCTICDLVGGDIMRLADGRSLSNNGKLKGKWIEVLLPSGMNGFVPASQLKPHDGFVSIAQGEGSAESLDPETTEAIIAEAWKLLRVPYLWGGMSSKGVDCSGLVRISFIMNGIHLPRNASQQINCGDRVAMDINTTFWDEATRESNREGLQKEMETRIKNLERGDLVFFGTPASTPGEKNRITHVGIYIGDGNILHSSHMVRKNSLLPDCEQYYENSWRLLGAIRL